MVVRVEALRTFVTVAEAGNITDAADRLGRTPSAVSMTLKRLEEHLGRPLFEGDRKSRLTGLGAYVLDQARREVEQFTQTVRSIESYARNEMGQISVACVPSFATLVLPLALQTYLARWPGIEVDIRDMDSRTVRRFVDQGRVDIGIATVPGRQVGLNVSPLMIDAFGVVCPVGHPLTNLDRPLSWADLDGHSLIANGICALIEAPEFQAVLGRSRLMVRNTTSILALVAAGVGITVLPRLAVPLDTDKACFLPLRYADVRRPLHILTRSNSALTPASEAFIDTLMESVPPNG
ncbi:MAG: LysR family transcriptional regulator [Alphaproteobacteria bacterium]|nr:LysR family transcriptional regulator [Alphaproteobacteria bacterium]